MGLQTTSLDVEAKREVMDNKNGSKRSQNNFPGDKQ